MSDKQIMSAKAILRKQLNTIINALPKEEKLRQSLIVTNRVLQNEKFKSSKVISIYLSMENEIETETILQEIFNEKKECFIPRFQSGVSEMEMIRLSSMEQYYALPKNKWNIKQPPMEENAESIFDRGQLDLVLTPGLGFTRSGLRLGRGKGYYDTFFKQCMKKLPNFPYTIGLAFKEQIIPHVPTEYHDFCLDLIIAPEEK